jgi:hypothetical protein
MLPIPHTYAQWGVRAAHMRKSLCCSLPYIATRKVIGGRKIIQLREGGIYGLGVEVSH